MFRNSYLYLISLIILPVTSAGSSFPLPIKNKGYVYKYADSVTNDPRKQLSSESFKYAYFGEDEAFHDTPESIEQADSYIKSYTNNECNPSYGCTGIQEKKESMNITEKMSFDIDDWPITSICPRIGENYGEIRQYQYLPPAGSPDTFSIKYSYHCPRGYFNMYIGSLGGLESGSRCVKPSYIGVGGDLVFRTLNALNDSYFDFFEHVGILVRDPVCNNKNTSCDINSRSQYSGNDSLVLEVLKPNSTCPKGQTCNPVNSQSVVYTNSYSSFINKTKFVGEAFNFKDDTGYHGQNDFMRAAIDGMTIEASSGNSSEYSLGFNPLNPLHGPEAVIIYTFDTSTKKLVQAYFTMHAVWRCDFFIMYLLKDYIWPEKEFPFSVVNTPKDFREEFINTQQVLHSSEVKNIASFPRRDSTKNQGEVEKAITVSYIINDPDQHYSFSEIAHAFQDFESEKISRDDEFNILWKGLFEYKSNPIIEEAIVDMLSYMKPLEFHSVIIQEYSSTKDVVLKNTLMRIMGESLSIWNNTFGNSNPNFTNYRSLLENNVNAQEGFHDFKFIVDASVKSGNKLALKYMIKSTIGDKNMLRLMMQKKISLTRYYNMEVSEFILKGKVKQLGAALKKNKLLRKVFKSSLANLSPIGIPFKSKQYLTDYARQQILQVHSDDNAKYMINYHWGRVYQRFIKSLNGGT